MPKNARETWYLPSPDGEGTLVFNTHRAGDCAGRGCALHDPSDHWARGMPMRWEYLDDVKLGFMERLCPHGAWHDDPDDLAFRLTHGMPGGGRPARADDCDCPCTCDHETYLPF